jgi:hypothetical protein
MQQSHPKHIGKQKCIGVQSLLTSLGYGDATRKHVVPVEFCEIGAEAVGTQIKWLTASRVPAKNKLKLNFKALLL